MRAITGMLVCVIACGPAARDPGNGSDDDDVAPDGAAAGECADGTELVYVIDQFANRLSTFDPATKTFTDLGTLNCQTTGGATPFSMSVDRHGTAWVLYTSGELFQVAIQGLGCTKSTWAGQNGLHVFGMGFSTDAVGGSEETLFVGGGANQMQTSYTLAKISTTTMMATPIGTAPQLPEMTGNGNAELWGFFPSPTMAKVVQFDKTNGAIVTSFDEPTLAGTMTGYAFAHWGGDYWVFLLKNGEPATTVYQVDGTTGAITSTTPTQGRTIVGAGVSTCAPTIVL